MRVKINKKDNCSCFTLIELMIVFVIICILATAGMIAYQGITVKAKAEKAQNNIALVGQAEKVWNIDNAAYRTVTWGQAVDARVGAGQTGMDLSGVDGDTDFAYQVTAAGLVRARNVRIMGTCAANTVISFNLATGVWTVPGCYR